MDSTDLLKLLIAFLAVEATNMFITANVPERSEEELETDLMKRYMIILVRATILIYSTSKKWPIAMCASITLMISILVIFVRLNMNNETSKDNEKQDSKNKSDEKKN